MVDPTQPKKSNQACLTISLVLGACVLALLCIGGIGIWAVANIFNTKLPMYSHINSFEVNAVYKNGDNPPVYRATFSTSDSLDLVLDYYRKTMPEQGWELVREGKATLGGNFMVYRKQENGSQFGALILIKDSSQTNERKGDLQRGDYAEMEKAGMLDPSNLLRTNTP